jgi:hypothetical protein
LDEAGATSSTANKGAPEPVPEPEAPLGEELPGLRHHNWQIWNCLRRNFPWSLPRTAIQYFRDCLHWGTLLISNLVLYSTREQAPDPDLEAGEALLSSIHHSAGETLYNLLQQAGMQAPQSCTMHELAAEIIDAQGDIAYASEVFNDLLTHQVHSFYFEQTVELVRLILIIG